MMSLAREDGKARQTGRLPTLSYGGINRIRFEGTLSPLRAFPPGKDPRVV